MVHTHENTHARTHTPTHSHTHRHIQLPEVMVKNPFRISKVDYTIWHSCGKVYFLPCSGVRKFPPTSFDSKRTKWNLQFGEVWSAQALQSWWLAAEKLLVHKWKPTRTHTHHGDAVNHNEMGVRLWLLYDKHFSLIFYVKIRKRDTLLCTRQLHATAWFYAIISITRSLFVPAISIVVRPI